MKKLSIFFFFFLFSLLVAQEVVDEIEELRSIVPLQSQKLINEGKLLHFSYNGKDEGEKIVFNSPLIEKIEKVFDKKTYLFGGEVLYFVKKTISNEQKDIEKIWLSISQLKGLQYYSPSRKKMRLLYKDCYAVKVEEKNGKLKYEKIEDPVNEEFDGLRVFVLQEDLTFGKNIYEFQYFSEGFGRALLVSNVEPLYYSIFKAIDKRDVNSYLIAYDLGDYLLVYAAVRANFRKIIGIESKVKNSFLSRLDAMSNWFISKYNE